MARAPLRDTDPAFVGSYRLTARLGAGGMGVVYLGTAPDGGLVAVKVLRPELADDPEFRERFGREVANLTLVEGVCTVRVIDAETDSASPFMATEYIPGPSLSEYVAAYGPPGPDMMYGLATGLAEALTVIHAAGVVHRDLKPSNVILGQDGPKVIDFGIAQALDATSVTRTGMMVGSAGFMAPEQVTGRAGQPADVFAWAVTLSYAASGEMPFGTGSADAILYRILHTEPDTAAVPERLRPLVLAALSKDPQRRPRADELLARLTNHQRADQDLESQTQAVLAQVWPVTEVARSRPSAAAKAPSGRSAAVVAPPPAMAESALLAPAASAAGAARRLRRPAISPRLAILGGVAAAAAVAAVVIFALTASQSPNPGQLAANQQPDTALAAVLGTYPKQQQHGVAQTVDRVVASGSTIVTIGSQTSDGVVRQQFFVSTDGGTSWHLAPTHASGGGPAPLGHAAARLAGGPGGWLAVGPQAIWTSKDGLSWTLASTQGVPQDSGDQLLVLTTTGHGFLAAGLTPASSGGTEAVIWTSPNGLTWQRKTATEVGLTASGFPAQGIVYGASHNTDTVISGGIAGGASASWLSTDGGSTWTAVTIPADHGASGSLAGLGSDGSGLIAVRPGPGPGGVSYFSPNGTDWQYAGTLDAAGGWTPALVKGGQDGFVAVGSTTDGQLVAYTATGTGGTWQPTGSLGSTADQAIESAALGTSGTVIAVGATHQSSPQPVFAAARPGGTAQPISLTSIAGGVVPELTVSGLAEARGTEIAVGSANGYPAVWRRDPSSGLWTLVSALSVVSAFPGATLTSVTHGPSGWLAVGGPGPVVFTSADGTSWQRATGAIITDLAGAPTVMAAANSTGYVIAANPAHGGQGAQLWFSASLASWTQANVMSQPSSSSQILAITAASGEFLAVGSTGGHPAVWTTSDGRTWTTPFLALPPGASAAQFDHVAIDGNRVAALGQQTTAAGRSPFAEMSSNSGASWLIVPFGQTRTGPVITALATGSSGFTAATQSGPSGQQAAQIWTSATGASWTQQSVTGLSGAGSHQVAALIPAASGVTGIGIAATTQSQQPITLVLP